MALKHWKDGEEQKDQTCENPKGVTNHSEEETFFVQINISL